MAAHSNLHKYTYIKIVVWRDEKCSYLKENGHELFDKGGTESVVEIKKM